MPGHCPGAPGKECVEGEPAPDGTPCSDEDANVCADAECVGGVCVRGDTEVGCGDLPTGPCQVAVDTSGIRWLPGRRARGIEHDRETARVLLDDGSTLDANDVVMSFTAGLDASSPYHVGNTGNWDYYSTLRDHLMNAGE